MVWSDPENIESEWAISPRGAGFLFGNQVTTQVTRARRVLLAERDEV